MLILFYSRMCHIRCQTCGEKEGRKDKGEEESNLGQEMICILVYVLFPATVYASSSRASAQLNGRYTGVRQ